MMNDPYAGLREQLMRDNDWPKVYLFKFIVPNDNQLLARAEALFGAEAQITRNESRTGKFISISAKEMMLNPEEVIERYQQAATIEGLIGL